MKFERYEHPVIALCCGLHCAITGSGDGMPDDEMHETVAWLAWRLGEFAPSLPKGGRYGEYTPFDAAVRDLMVATLAECAGYLASRRQS